MLDKRAEIEQQWKNIFDLDTLKSSIQMIAIFITVYELLESTVINKPKDFFIVWEWDDKAKADYRERVLSLYDPEGCPGISERRKDIISSLLWFKSMQAIDDNDIKIFADSKKLRNHLAHQMLESIADGGNKIVEQFALMYSLFCKLERWWILEIEIPINGDFDADEVDEGGVMSGNMVVLDAIMDILGNDSNVHYKEVCEKIGVPIK